MLTSEDLTSYIYTDRPIYRPAQKVYFKGILRQWGRERLQTARQQNRQRHDRRSKQRKDFREGTAAF